MTVSPMQIWQATQDAVDRMLYRKYANNDVAWKHDYPASGPNPHAPTPEQIKLAEEMAEITPEQITAMLNTTDMSAALKSHLEERGLTPDSAPVD